MFFLLALGGPRRVVSAPWLNRCIRWCRRRCRRRRSRGCSSGSPARHRRKRARAPAAWARMAAGIVRLSAAGARIGVGTDGGGQTGRSVRRLDRAHRGREHGGRRDDAGPGADGRDANRGRPSSVSPTSAPSPPARAPTSSCSTPTRSTTSPTPVASPRSTCAARAVDRARLGGAVDRHDSTTRVAPAGPDSEPCAARGTDLSYWREPGRARRGLRPRLRCQRRRLVVRVGREGSPDRNRRSPREPDAARREARGGAVGALDGHRAAGRRQRAGAAGRDRPPRRGAGHCPPAGRADRRPASPR